MSKNHYVDNKKLYAAMVEYKKQYNEAIKNGTEKPRVSEYIGHCIYLIASNLTNYYKFINYSYKDEMISNAYLYCIQYIHNFNADKYKNPHAYFTMIAYRGFQKTIKDEKKQLYIKYKNMQKHYVLDVSEEEAFEYQEKHDVDLVDMNYEKMNDFIADYEESLTNRKKKVKVGVDKFIEEKKDE